MQTCRQILLDVYQDMYGPKITLANLSELARDLSQIAGRTRPWTGKFLHSLIKEYGGFSPNSHLTKALTILAAQLDGVNEIQARAREAQGILAINDLPAGTIVLGQAQRCDRPGCPVHFVPTHPRQKYHSKECAEAARSQRYNRKRSSNQRVSQKSLANETGSR